MDLVKGLFFASAVAVFATSFSTLVLYSAPASQVIAGSDSTSPPSFWEGSFFGLTSSIDQAFPFTPMPEGVYRVHALEIAVFHYVGLAGNSATFSIYDDAAGEPGNALADFLIDDISTTAEVHTLLPPTSIVLDSDAQYWLVGQTTHGQVNWNLGNNTFGPSAFRSENGAWNVRDYTNVSAYAILGTRIPEPSAICLVGLLGLGATCLRAQRNRKISGP